MLHRLNPLVLGAIVMIVALVAAACGAETTTPRPTATTTPGLAAPPVAPVDCMAPPPTDQDLTITGAWPASPPAVDEITFETETEHVLAMAYIGELVQWKHVWNPTYQVCGLAMDLPGDQGIIGRWADKWEMSNNGLTWKFHIKPGIKSYFGNEMTCENYRWTWERAFEMRSDKYFHAVVMNIEDPASVVCTDTYDVQFNLTQPSTNFLKLMINAYYGGPFDSVEAKKHATASDPFAKDWLKNNTAGFGPYHLIKNIPGVELELVRNPNYEPRPAVGRIVIKIIPDSATRLALLKRGEIDFASRLRQREYDEAEKDPNLQVVRYIANFIPYFGPVQTNPIMANVKVRQAMAYAVPYAEIQEKVYGGKGVLIKSITPDIFPNYTDKFWVYKTDLNKAKELLKEAGYENGFDLTISYDKASGEMEEACILIKGSFEKIGIKTTLEGLSAAVYSEKKAKRELMAQCDNHQWPTTADTGYAAGVYLSRAKTNRANSVGFDDPEFDELTAKMMTTPHGDERVKMDLRIQEIAAQKLPWIFLVNPGWREAVKKEWKGFHWNPDNHLYFEWMYK